MEKCNMALYFFSIHNLITMIYCLQPNEIGVCYRTLNGNQWLECCKGYRILQGKCEKCPPGKYSEHCERDCPYSFYGEGCLSKCNCNEHEYCDNVFGCICKNCTKTENITENLTTQDKRTGTDINVSLLLYIGIPCAVFFITTVTTCICKIRKRRCKMGEAKINVSPSLNPNTERPYDYIDESILEDMSQNNKGSTKHQNVSSFINSCDNSENSSVNSFETAQQSSVYREIYLNPYSSLQTEVKPVSYDIPSETSTTCDIPTKSKDSYDIPRSST